MAIKRGEWLRVLFMSLETETVHFFSQVDICWEVWEVVPPGGQVTNEIGFCGVSGSKCVTVCHRTIMLLYVADVY